MHPHDVRKLDLNSNEHPSAIASFDLSVPLWLQVVLFLAVGFELLAPFFTHTYGMDSRFHLLWIQQFSDLIFDGIFFPRWTPEGFFGMGSPTFYFYPPLTYYVAAVIRVAIGITTPIAVFQIINFLGTVGSFFTARLLLRELGSRGKQLTIASALYAVAPIRIVEIYHRGALPTHVCYVLIPLVIMGLIQIFRGCCDGAWKRILLTGVSSAFLGLTNVPFAVVSIFCIVAAGIVSWKLFDRRIILELIMVAIVAFSLTAFHFTASLSLAPYAALDLHVPHLPVTWDSIKGSLLAYYHIVLVYAAIVIILLSFWKESRSAIGISFHERIFRNITLSIFAVIIILDLPWCYSIWNRFAPLQIVVFNWRFYSFILLLTAILVGIARTKTLQRGAQAIVALWTIAALGQSFLVLFNLHIASHFDRAPEEASEYRPAYVLPSPKDPFNLFDTLATLYGPHRNDSPIFNRTSSIEHISLMDAKPDVMTYNALLESAKTITFHRFLWPTWHLRRNGTEIPTLRDSLGRAIATLPSGHYTFRWQLERTPLETAGFWISGFAWCGVIITSGIGLVRTRVRRKRATSP
jgi:hypothetical protein